MAETTEWVREVAPAKVNLTLHVTGQREDGYHLLDSLVAFASDGDVLELREGPKLSLSVAGPFADGVPTDRQNLVWKAAELAGWTGEIKLTKNLPHGGGIGGGSADAAALLRAVGFQGDALPLGADVPVCQLGRAAHMSGIGDAVAPLPEAPVAGAFALLVNPGVEVATPDVFRALTERTNAAMEAFPPAGTGAAPWLDWLLRQRNDLETPAISVAPVISDVIAALRDTEACLLARMSGSGSTCFALYPDGQTLRAAAAHIEASYPGWWVAETSLS